MNFLSDQASIAKCFEVSCKAETDPKATLIMLVDKAFSKQKKDWGFRSLIKQAV